jgi:hypothetical protein
MLLAKRKEYAFSKSKPLYFSGIMMALYYIYSLGKSHGIHTKAFLEVQTLKIKLADAF